MNKNQRIENEGQILKLVSEGDSQAFRTLYMHYYDRLFNFAMLFLHSEAASEDVIGDVFFVIWKERSMLTSIPNFHPYIYQAVRNGCLNVLKSGYISKRDDIPDTELQINISTETPLDELSYKELHHAVKQAIISLPERCRIIFKMAKEDGTLTQYFETLDSTFSSCDIIFLCAPVSNNIEYLKELKGIISESCLLTDVGSVKEPIQSAIKELGMESNFIGGHPMVGSEKSGYAHANDHLLENAYYFLTPSERTLFQLTTKFSSFIQGLGALAVSLKPEEHDFITAAISHVPHIVAAELVHLVRRADRNNGMLKQLAAGGFKDITRIASSSPVMWEQICENNSSNIKTLLTSMIHDLQEVIDQLDKENGAYVNEYFKEAGDYRNSVPDHSIGLFDKVHKLYVHIPDQPGTIATVASLLAFNNISLKNIGIIYNREFEEGVLEIVLYDEESCQKGAQVLEERNYMVHIR